MNAVAVDEPNSLVEYALAYANFGWPVIPLHNITAEGRCSCGAADCVNSAGKHPRTEHGVKEATTDPDIIRRWWKRFPQANIGIATGASKSGFIAYDVDPKNGGHISHDHAVETNGKMPETLVVRTGNGGTHYWFRTKEPIGNRTNIIKGVDIRGEGGYVAAPPSRTAMAYEFVDDDPFMHGTMPGDMPVWLRQLLGTRAATSMAPIAGVKLAEDEIAEIRGALASLALTEAVDDYDKWLRVGMALHSTGAQNAFALWCEWSSTCPEKFDLGTCKQKWNSFSSRHDGVTLGTLWQMAEETGWKRPAPQAVFRMEAGDDRAEGANPLPDHLYNVPGVLSEFVKWTLDTATMRQPQLTIAAALNLGAAAMARRYRWKKTRTSLMQITVAPSAAGKEHPRGCIKKAMRAAGIDTQLLGEEIKSGSAFWRASCVTPNGLALLDEYGLYLQGVMRKGADQHRKEFAEILMRLATSYEEPLVKGAEYADDKANPRRDIEHPCIGLYASTTMETLAPALGSEHVLSGFLNRHLVLQSEVGLQRARDVDMTPCPDRVVAWLKRLAHWRPEDKGDLYGRVPGSPIELGMEHRANEALAEFTEAVYLRRQDLIGRPEDALWGRAVEHAKKVAMVLAGSLWDGPPGPPVVTLEAMRWAIDYVVHCVGVASHMVNGNLADSDFERVLNHCRKHIRAAGRDGLTERELVLKVKAFRSLRPNERREVLIGLEQDGPRRLTINRNDGKGGRARIAWVDEFFLAGMEAEGVLKG